MVNLNKWEEIEYEDIRVDDLIRLVRTDGIRKFEYTSKAESYDDHHKWWVMEGNWYATGGDDDPGWTKTIYRKVKPFKAPQGLGAVVTVKYEDGSTLTYVRVDHDTECWRDTSGYWFIDDEELQGLTGQTVLSEGVDVPA